MFVLETVIFNVKCLSFNAKNMFLDAFQAERSEGYVPI